MLSKSPKQKQKDGPISPKQKVKDGDFRKSAPAVGSFVVPKEPARPMNTSQKTLEIPTELLSMKSPRGTSVSVQEAQLMKSPNFVLAQLQKEASDWLEYDKAFTDGKGNAAASRLADFDVLEEAGRGRFGEVFKAREKSSGKMYAIKSILREDREDIRVCIQHALVERKILSSVSHPYICEFKCAFQDPLKVYFVLQFLPGGDLMKLIEKTEGKGLNKDVVMIYSAEIALAINYLHEHHILYRDLKPENVMIDEDRHARLTDFGLSKIVVSRRTFSLCGTPQFVAPEMVAHNRALVGYDRMVDWWSLGVMVHEMASAKLPFDDTNWEMLQKKIMSDLPVYPESIREKGLTTLLNGLLAKEARNRFGLEQMKSDAFYKPLDWKALAARNIPAPI